MENNNNKMETVAIDDFINCQSKDKVLHSYLDQLSALSAYAERNYAIEPNEFFELLYEEIEPVLLGNKSQRYRHTYAHSHKSLNKCRQAQPNAINYVYKRLKRCAVYVGFVCVLIALVNCHTDISRLFMRNIQTFIYPGMRYWRKLTLPIIRELPQLTNLYDESCLLSNPFFQVAELDCAPCTNVINIVDLTGYLGHFDNSIPHVIREVSDVHDRYMNPLTFA